MIKNERQYRLTKAQARRFSQTLASLNQRSAGEVNGAHPLITKAQQDALESQLADLEAELREYDSLKSGQFPVEELGLVAELPTLLVKARVSQGLSQKDLAQRLGLKEQQIQRYESTDYASASLARILEVVNALSAESGSDGTTA